MLPCFTHGAIAQITLSSGMDYSLGKYGSMRNTSTLTLPVVAKYESEAWVAKVSWPYLRINNVNINARGESLPCGAALSTPKDVSGMGDLVAGVSTNLFQGNGYLVDVGGKIKFATGDTKKCLSTGKNDYSLQIELAKQIGPFTVSGTGGWTRKGDPLFMGVATNYRNPFFYTLGAHYRISSELAIGASFDYRQRLTSIGDPISELTMFSTLKQSPSFKLQSYVLTGFSNASADHGAGIVAIVGF